MGEIMRKAKKLRHPETLVRSGVITRSTASFSTHFQHNRGTPPERVGDFGILIEGKFTEPLSNITDFHLYLSPRGRQPVGDSRPNNGGWIPQVKPTVGGIIDVMASEFQLLIMMTAVGTLKSLYLAFDKPHYGSARIISARVSTNPDEATE